MPEPAESTLDLTVMVACYNEEGNIAPTLATLEEAMRGSRLTWEAIVFDDGSRDRSVEVVERYIREHPQSPIRLVVAEENRGLAQNYVEGAFLGRGKYYRLICGDNVEDVGTMRHAFGFVGVGDMVTFYHQNAPRTLFRRFLSWLFTWIVNVLSGYRLRYYNGCSIHHRYNVMRWHTNYHGFGFQADLICRLLDEGFNHMEAPIKAAERPTGHSKALTMKNLLSVAHTFLDLAIRRTANLLYRRNRGHRPRPIWRERLDLRGTGAGQLERGASGLATSTTELASEGGSRP